MLAKRIRILRSILCGICCVWMLGGIMELSGQDKPVPDKPVVIQMYGFVLTLDEETPLLGAHIYHPRTRRGTSTDYYGYFSLPVRVGDTMRVNHIGYNAQEIIIPQVEGDSYQTVVYMEVRIEVLDPVEVTLYMNEEHFKQAILAFNTLAHPASYVYAVGGSPGRVYQNPSANYRYFLQQQRHARDLRYSPAYLSFTDILLRPLIESIKKKNKKKKRR